MAGSPGSKKKWAAIGGAVVATATLAISGVEAWGTWYGALHDNSPVAAGTVTPTSDGQANDANGPIPTADLPYFALQVKQHLGEATVYRDEVHVVGTGEVYVRVQYRNPGPDENSNVILTMDVPQQFQVDLGKISVLDANNPQGAIVAGVQPTDKGFEINLGGFTPGSNAFIAFAMNLRDPGQLDCGENTFALRAAFVDSEQNRTDKSNEVRVIYTPGPCRPRNS